MVTSGGEREQHRVRTHDTLFGTHEHLGPGDRVELTSPKSAKHIFK